MDVELIAFNEEGSAMVSPDVDDEWSKKRVEVSIKRLKLNEHEALTEARRSKWQAVLREIESFERAKARCADGQNPAAEEKLRSHVRMIRELASKEEPLSSVVRWCLSFRNDMQLLRLAS